MALYLVHHSHTDETCPAKNPELVRIFAAHVNQANGDKYGVRILADFVNDPEHTVILVVEADSMDKVHNFVTPFINVGPTTIKEGYTCEQVAQQCLKANDS